MSNRQSARIEVMLLLAAGALLLAMGARYSAGSILLLPSTESVAKLQLFQAVPAAELDDLIENQTLALQIDPSGEGWSNLGLALALKEQTTPSAESISQDSLSPSEVALRKSLGLAPLNPFAWIRLALIEQVKGKPVNDILRFWRFSELVGPSEPRLATPRADLALIYWPELTPEDRRILFSNLRQAWRYNSPVILAWATIPSRIALMRASLVFDLPELARFEKALATARNTSHG